MDELNKFKVIWDRSLEQSGHSFDLDKIEVIIRKKSLSPVDKLKRSLKIEIYAILIAMPVLVYVLVELPFSYFIINTSVLLIVLASLLAYYSYNLKKVNQIWSPDYQPESIKKSLESTLELFGFYRKIYFWLNMILFPMGVYFGFHLGFGIGSGGERVNLALAGDISTGYILLAIITIFFISMWLFRLLLNFYIRKLYDVHINKLRKNLQELSETE